MRKINIHEAKTHLSRLVDEAANGEGFIIAKAGKPMVVVRAVTIPEAVVKKRFGFLEGAFAVPDSFDALGRDEIDVMFHGGE